MKKKGRGSLTKRRCKIYYILERKLIVVAIKINSTMLRECAAIVTTDMGGSRNLGGVLMKSYMRQECVKTVTSTTIIVREGRRTQG